MSDILGDIVVYSLSNDISIDREELEKRVENEKILKTLVPKCMGVATAFRKATDEAIKGFDYVELREVPLRLCPENTLVRTVELVTFSAETQEPVIEQVASICLDKVTGEIKYNLHKKSLGATILEKTVKEFHKLYSKVLTIREIREYIQRVFYCCYSVKLRRNGGIDFVPEDTFDLLESMFQSLHGFKGIDFTRITVSNVKKNREALCKFLLAQMDDYIKEEIYRLTYKEETSFLPVNKFIRALFTTNAGVSVINRMLQRFSVATLKTNIYTNLLNEEMDNDLLKRMKDAKEELEDALEERKEW